MNERDKIIDKIKKCLALSASSNEHEAAAALRQAEKLMAAHGVSDLDMLAAEAEECRTKAGAGRHPAGWETMLANTVGRAFGCRVIFATAGFSRATGSYRAHGEWCFVGTGASPEIAQYAFAVLLRQIQRARTEHIKTRLKRCKTATKTRRADLYCEGWVLAVASTVTAFATGEQQLAAIEAYIEKRHTSLTDLKSRDRNAGRNLREHEHTDYLAGNLAGRDAQINRGVGGAEAHKALR